MVDLTCDDFDKSVLHSKLPVVVEFWAPWCVPCKALMPTVTKLSIKYSDKVKFCNVNIDDYPELSVRYKVKSIPALLFFVQGELIETLFGTVKEKKIVDIIEGW